MEVLTNYKVMLSQLAQLQMSYSQLKDEFIDTKEAHKTISETNLRERQLYIDLKEMYERLLEENHGINQKSEEKTFLIDKLKSEIESTKNQQKKD